MEKLRLGDVKEFHQFNTEEVEPRVCVCVCVCVCDVFTMDLT